MTPEQRAEAAMKVLESEDRAHKVFVQIITDAVEAEREADRVAKALHLILEDSKVKVVLINIFGGITRCDEVAQGILRAIDDVNTRIPMVIRLVGTNEKEGRQIIAKSKYNLKTANSLVEAAQEAVAVAH